MIWKLVKVYPLVGKRSVGFVKKANSELNWALLEGKPATFDEALRELAFLR